MATLEENLQTLDTTKSSFKTKFSGKDISTTDIEFTSYPNLIDLMEKILPDQTKTVDPTTSAQEITADTGKKLVQVNINAIQTEEKTVKSTETEQEITPTTDKFISKVTVSPIVPQTKNISPTTSAQQITADEGYDYLDEVNVSAVTNSIDSNIQASNIKKDVSILGVTGTLESGSGGTPPITTGGLFTGATIPLTYKDNTHTYENTYKYKSAGYNITITGLTGRATITGNGTKSVSVAFDVTSATSSLAEFVISLSDGTNTYNFNGIHAHYGTTVTGILTLAYTNIPRTGTGTIGTEYKFIETTSTDLPYFSTNTILWNTIYSYQVLNTLIGNFSATSIGGNFLATCYSFNQPLTIPSSVTSIGSNFLNTCYSFNQPLTISSGEISIGNYFLYNCYSFNQPLDISSVTSIGTGFLYNCYSFNQPLTIPSSVTSIGNSFLATCYSFNQPLTIPSGEISIGDYFLYNCYSFNQPLDISSVTSIGTGFLQFCYSFNQPLTIPSSVTSIGSNFLYNCYSLSTITYNSSVFPIDNNSLSQTVNSKTSASGAGIIVYGTQRAGLITALHNRTASPYRKLINGGAD